MSDIEITWSNHIWRLCDFSEDIHHLIRDCQKNVPLLIDRINGDEVYARRIDYDCFQCGVVAAQAADGHLEPRQLRRLCDEHK